MSVRSQQAEAFAQQKRLDAESLLGFMVGEFADKLRSVKRMDLLDGISNKALEYFSQQDDDYDEHGLFSLSDQALNFKARFQHAQTLGAMGEVAYSRAKNGEAKKAFSSAKVILDKLYVEQANNLELLKTLGANAFWLGQLAYDGSDLDTAQPLFELYRDFSEEMNRLEPENVDGWVELYYANSTLGSLYLKQQNYTQAKTAFESSLALNNRVLELRPFDDVLLSDKADTLSWLGKTELHFGELTHSIQYIQQGQEILENLLKSSPDNARIMEILVQTYMQIASLLELKQMNEIALSNLLLAEQLIIKIVDQDKGNENWRHDLLLVYLMEATLRSKLALVVDNSSINIDELTNIITDHETPSLQLLFRTVRYLQINRQWDESKKYIELAKNQLFVDENELIKDQDQKKLLSNLELLEANLFFQQNKPNNAVHLCNRVALRLSSIIRNTQHPYFLLPYVKAQRCIGQLNEARDELQRIHLMGVTTFDFINPL
jgi:tetratricopeptide (TPR) repeat protein